MWSASAGSDRDWQEEIDRCAIRRDAFGGPEVLKAGEVADPAPLPTEVVNSWTLQHLHQVLRMRASDSVSCDAAELWEANRTGIPASPLHTSPNWALSGIGLQNSRPSSERAKFTIEWRIERRSGCPSPSSDRAAMFL
jgi:hypothetical protein